MFNPLGFMLASKEKNEEKLQKLWESKEWAAQEKFDGSRYQLCGGRLRSRKISVKTDTYTDKTDNVPHILEAAREIFGSLNDVIIDGEIVHPQGWGSSQSVMGSLPDRAKEWQKKNGMVMYQIFDIILFKGKETWKMPYKDRHDMLQRLVRKYSPSSIINVQIIRVNEKDKRALHSEIVRRGGEGVILKNLNHPYMFDRSKSWIKIKGKETYDVIVMGFTDAEEWYAEPETTGADGVFYKKGRRTKFFEKGWIGAIEFGLYKDGELVKVGQCSGLTDELREKISEDKKDFIGRVMEITCQQRMKTGGFRHVNFFRFRDDKSAKDCIDTRD